MFLSIVIPIYNDELYLHECLDSCLNQRLSKDEYEIICVDDGSTDRTREILQTYASKYPNIHLMLMDRYKGGRTVGFQRAKGDYVWFVDHDDIVAPHAIDDLKQIALENPDYERIAFPCYEFFDALTDEEQQLLRSKSICCNDNNVYQDLVTWSSIIRVQFLRENDISPRPKRIDAAGEFWGIKDFSAWSVDTIFLDECLEKGIHSLRISGRPLYHYRRHENTQTMSQDPEMVKQRDAKKYNTGLYWTYLAVLQKRRYEEERSALGKVSEETAVKTFERIRKAVYYMQKLPDKDWKRGFKRMKEIDFFFTKMPDNYPVSFQTYWKRCSVVERLMPSVAVSYFNITARGAKWSWLLSWPVRVLNSNKRYLNKKKEKKHARLLSKGTGKTSV